MIKIGIIGVSGYTGAELARILSNHPKVSLTVATSRQYAGKRLAEVFPHLQGVTDIVCQDIHIDNMPQQADIFFTAVPHKSAMAIVPHLLSAGKKVIDLSADFRLHNVKVYEQWYQPHTAQEYLAEAVYGLPELHRDQIKACRLIANPGCYPTSIILGLAPLLAANIIAPETIVADAKSGTSGAGRTAQTAALYCEVNDGFRAYKIGNHRHTPEIEQEISLLCNQNIALTFTPHLLPMSRGIYSTIYATSRQSLEDDELYQIYQDFYQDEPFIRLCQPGTYPATQFVRGSNFCDIGFKFDKRTNRIIIMSVIDNLVKGAAGQGVQNMNLLCGFPETAGLAALPLFP